MGILGNKNKAAKKAKESLEDRVPEIEPKVVSEDETEEEEDIEEISEDDEDIEDDDEESEDETEEDESEEETDDEEIQEELFRENPLKAIWIKLKDLEETFQEALESEDEEPEDE